MIESPGWWQIRTPSVPSPGVNEVVQARIDGDIDARIDAVIEGYRALGLPWKWVVGPDSAPSELAEHLSARAEHSWPATKE